MTLVLFCVGLTLLIVGAEWLVSGASKLALAAGVSPLVIGLTIVAFGTSAPEAAVSIGAALDGRAGVAVGNVLGSNVFNLLVILGVSAVLTPLAVSRQVVRQELPVLLLVSLISVGLIYDGALSRAEGAALLALLFGYTAFLIVQSRRETARDSEAARAAGAAQAIAPSAAGWRALGLNVARIVVGLGFLVVGAGWVVDGATALARALGVGETLIGLTVIAAGTSLPEVATSITAALRGERDLAVGNVVGSNAFNLLGCLGGAGLAASDGIAVPAEVITRDCWVMLAATALCVPIFRSGSVVSRAEGALLLTAYFGYMAFLARAAQMAAS
ncbi:MAG: calcium/sodium antiporter [Planctomycetota bacterium]